MHKQPKHSTGFTLVELIVTIAIAAVVLGIAIPSFNSSISRNRLTTYINEFVTALNLARSEAIKRGITVTMRKLDNQSCTNLAALAEWENGWDVFTDADADGTCDASDVLIRTYQSLPPSYTLRGNNNFRDRISYRPDGTSNTIGSFALCDNSDGNNLPEAYTSKLLTVNFAGRLHMGIDTNNNGIPEKDDGVTELNSCTAP